MLEVCGNEGGRTPIYRFLRLSVARPPVSSDRVETAVSSNKTAVSTCQTWRDRRLGKRDRRLALRRWRDRRPGKRDRRLAIHRWRDRRLAKRDGALVPKKVRNLIFVQKIPPILVWGLIVSPSGFLGFVHLRKGGLLIFIVRSGKIWDLQRRPSYQAGRPSHF